MGMRGKSLQLIVLPVSPRPATTQGSAASDGTTDVCRSRNMWMDVYGDGADRPPFMSFSAANAASTSPSPCPMDTLTTAPWFTVTNAVTDGVEDREDRAEGGVVGRVVGRVVDGVHL